MCPSKILVVDDSQHMRHVIRSAIEQRCDWTVCGEAENGAIAIALVKTLKPHLVILDFAMPVMNGLDAARGISAISPSMPMVMLTLYYSHSLLQEAQKVGIKHVFPKGGEFTEVFEAMRAMLPA